MADMQKFLVPVDGSQNANRAVAQAIELAKSLKDVSIVLLNVQEQLERWYAHGLNSEAARAHLREQGEREASEARKLLGAAGCLYEFAIVFGKPAEVIVRIAEEKGCTGIIMGTRGLGDVESLFLGSTSYQVFHLARVPVTLVR